MVKTSNSLLFPPDNMWQLPNCNGISTSVETVQPGCLPACLSPSTYTFSANMATPRIGISSIPNLKMQRINGAQQLPQISFPPFQNLFPARIPFLKENIPAFSGGFAGEAVPNVIPGCQKGFVIFDQSGSETRLIYSSFSPTALRPTIASAKPTGGYLHCEHVDKLDPINLTVPKLQEVSDENLLSGEDGEMHEDTEEINALLDSDDDYDDNGDDDDRDEDDVTSTGHSPVLFSSYGMRGRVEEVSEEVHNSDGQNKRQKLLDGGYKRSSLADIPSSQNVVGFNRHDDDAESSYVIGQHQEANTIANLDNKLLKKDKVLGTLRILEGIIPGAKDKDPLLVLDLAIDYLKALKLKAKALGLNYS